MMMMIIIIIGENFTLLRICGKGLSIREPTELTCVKPKISLLSRHSHWMQLAVILGAFENCDKRLLAS